MLLQLLARRSNFVPSQKYIAQKNAKHPKKLSDILNPLFLCLFSKCWYSFLGFFFFFNDHFMLYPWTVPYNPVALIITYNLMTPKFKLPTQTSFLNIRHTDPISYRHFHLVVLLAYSLSMCKSHLSPLPHLFIPSHAMGRVCMCVLVCLGELH